MNVMTATAAQKEKRNDNVHDRHREQHHGARQQAGGRRGRDLQQPAGAGQPGRRVAGRPADRGLERYPRPDARQEVHGPQVGGRPDLESDPEPGRRRDRRRPRRPRNGPRRRRQPRSRPRRRRPPRRPKPPRGNAPKAATSPPQRATAARRPRSWACSSGRAGQRSPRS